ncbi:unnamed protein product [Colias eurytheme]|nr:unnamed protein product [Colias eurytheme]
MDVVVLYWYYRRLRLRKPRRYWIHPLLRERCRGAAFVRQLKEDESKFFAYFRMTTSTFDDLLKRLEKDLKKKDTIWRKSLCLK